MIIHTTHVAIIRLFVIALLCIYCFGAHGIADDCDDEWKRTDPDIVVYIPENEADGDNEHFLVFEAPLSDELLAVWTQSSVEGHGDNRAMFARSQDGESWSEPIVLVGKAPGRENNRQASWAFPLVSDQGRIYILYTAETPNVDTRQASGSIGTVYSDDNGETWTEGEDIPVPRIERYDHVDPAIAPNWIVWQIPIRDSSGRRIAGYTRVTSESRTPRATPNWPDVDSHSGFIRFEIIDENPSPSDLVLSWLPSNDELLSVPHKLYPEISVAQEPAVVLLPDGRLFTVMRTMTGHIWYSVSDNDGDTWCATEPLKYTDSGDPINNPIAPCPLYRLDDGRYLLLFYNNAGVRGEYDQFKEVWNNGNQLNYLRNPASIAVGEFRENAHQPLWFSEPRVLLDTDFTIFGPKRTSSVATYPSMTEQDGERVLWYPDRKHFLLGKRIPDSLLEDMTVPVE